MRVSRWRPAILVLAALVPLSLSGCGLLGDGSGSGGGGKLPDDAREKATQRVQSYLDAMKAKDVAAGRNQFCAIAQDAFDQAATGPNGDFAEHFTVPSATITGVRSAGGRQEVTASVTVDADDRNLTVALLFSVARQGSEWCIASETVDNQAASPTPTATP